MAKQVVEVVRRFEGSSRRLHAVIECTCCGHRTSVRNEKKRLEEALNADCSECLRLSRQQVAAPENSRKKVVGKVHRKEGKEERLYSKIVCKDCGAITYERRQNRVNSALASECRSCKLILASEKEETRRIVRLQDKALIDAHRAIKNLIPKVDRRITHGLSTGINRRTYNVWNGMMSRCYVSTTNAFEHYGGRGICVCERWHDVRNFFEDMGLVPDGYSIERIDVDGDYEPSNCMWLPLEQQSWNRRCSYKYRGITDLKEHKEQQKVRYRQKARLDKGIPSDAPLYSKKHLNPNGWWWPCGLTAKAKQCLYGPHVKERAFLYQSDRYKYGVNLP